MTNRDHIRYIAEVVIKDDRGIWAVKYFPDMDDEKVKQLAARQYGIKPEWVIEIRRKKRPSTPKMLFNPIYEPIHIPNRSTSPWWDDEELVKGLTYRMGHRKETGKRTPRRRRMKTKKRTTNKITKK